MMKEKVSNGGTLQEERGLFRMKESCGVWEGFGMIIRAEEPGVKVSEGSPDRPSPALGRWPWSSHTRRVGPLLPL